jgi:hypothetical protein
MKIGIICIHLGNFIYEYKDEAKDIEFYINVIFQGNSLNTKTISNANELNFDESLVFLFYFVVFIFGKILNLTL